MTEENVNKPAQTMAKSSLIFSVISLIALFLIVLYRYFPMDFLFRGYLFPFLVFLLLYIIISPILSIIFGIYTFKEVQDKNKEIRKKIIKKITLASLFISLFLIFLSVMIPIVRKSTRKIACSSNLKIIGLACRMYSGANDDQLPLNLQMLINENYLRAESCYKCPSNDEKPLGYIYTGRGFTEGDNFALPLAFDKPDNHTNYVNILYLDGHVKGELIKGLEKSEDIIMYLNKINKYSERDLKMLLKNARNQAGISFLKKEFH